MRTKPRPQVEPEAPIDDELRTELLVAVMTEPAGPLKSRSRVGWRKRPRSGPTNENAERDFG